MKKIGEYTARGQIANQTTQRITLFDGRFDTGYKIISFHVFPDEPYTAAADVVGVLATESAAATDDWDLGDNRQVAWASVDIRTGGFAAGGGTTDPDNFIIEDLFVHGKNEIAVPSITSSRWRNTKRPIGEALWRWFATLVSLLDRSQQGHDELNRQGPRSSPR